MADTGTDISCIAGFRRHMPAVSGDQQIAQLAARGLSKSPDRFPFVGWGRDLRDYILSKAPIQQICAYAEAQVLTDERVRVCFVTGTRTEKAADLRFACVKEDGGSLTFTLSITEAAVGLIGLQRG
jgi:hypothetical protein